MVATKSVPPRVTSVTPTTAWPLTVLVALLLSFPWLASAESISLRRSVSEEIEAKSELVAGAFSHLPCKSCAAAGPPMRR